MCVPSVDVNCLLSVTNTAGMESASCVATCMTSSNYVQLERGTSKIIENRLLKYRVRLTRHTLNGLLRFQDDPGFLALLDYLLHKRHFSKDIYEGHGLTYPYGDFNAFLFRPAKYH